MCMSGGDYLAGFGSAWELAPINRAAPAWLWVSPYEPRTEQMSIYIFRNIYWQPGARKRPAPLRLARTGRSDGLTVHGSEVGDCAREVYLQPFAEFAHTCSSEMWH